MNAIQKRMQVAIEASAERAKLLTQVGMEVAVVRDDGRATIGKLTRLPWQLGHGAWVASVEGISGGYDCARISPVRQTGGDWPESGVASDSLCPADR